MRRLRAGLVTPHPGGAGAPPGTTTSPREELADGGPSRPARRLDLSDGPKGVCPSPNRRQDETAPRKRGPGAEMRTPRWSAERRPHIGNDVRLYGRLVR